jgi:hypothetical protein
MDEVKQYLEQLEQLFPGCLAEYRQYWRDNIKKPAPALEPVTITVTAKKVN